jgi:hypothetical protein
MTTRIDSSSAARTLGAEPGYDPGGIAAARVAEVAAVVFLGAFLVGRLKSFSTGGNT